MIFTGIDPSLTETGITIMDNGSVNYFLIKSSKNKNSESPSIEYTRRILDIVDRIMKILDREGSGFIALEGLSYGSKNSRSVFELGALSHIIRERIILERKIDFIIVPPKTLKFYFCGNGNASKLDVIKKCEERELHIPFFKKISGVNYFNHNICDSYALADFAKNFYENDDFPEMKGVESCYF